VTYRWKDLNEGYNFSLDFIAIEDLYTKLWAPKSGESHVWEFRGAHLGISRQKVIWMWPLWIYYKGEGGGFPQVQGRGESYESKLPVGRLSTKSASTMH
jgi:hypothetical protein